MQLVQESKFAGSVANGDESKSINTGANSLSMQWQPVQRYILDRFCPGCAPIPLLWVPTSLETGHDGDGHNQSSGSPSVPNLYFGTLEDMTILD